MQSEPSENLIRGVGVTGATTLNMIDMIGVGPFITMPLIIAAMGGPQAMIGWIAGAVVCMCGGLVWAELGASMPKSGGPYNYLKEIYGPNRLGRLMSFLFIWQLTFSAPLSIASGGIGLSQYATYIFPSMGTATKLSVPILGTVEINSFPIIFVAVGVLGIAVFLLYRRITIIEKMSKFFWIVVIATILGVIPWREFSAVAATDAQKYVVSAMMERLYGPTAGVIATVLIIFTAFASVFSLLLGYSRVPYAAALDGNYFKIFSKLHPVHRFPYISLLTMGAIAAVFCFFRLADVIAAMVVIRILVQFVAQIVGLMILRKTRPEMPRPFKMWLYPVPAVCALVGFLYVMFMRKGFLVQVKYAAVLIVTGVIIYLVRSYKRKEFPFGSQIVTNEII